MIGAIKKVRFYIHGDGWAQGSTHGGYGLFFCAACDSFEEAEHFAVERHVNTRGLNNKKPKTWGSHAQRLALGKRGLRGSLAKVWRTLDGQWCQFFRPRDPPNVLVPRAKKACFLCCIRADLRVDEEEKHAFLSTCDH